MEVCYVIRLTRTIIRLTRIHIPPYTVIRRVEPRSTLHDQAPATRINATA